MESEVDTSSGIEHLKLLHIVEERNRARNATQFGKYLHELDLIGTSMYALYQAATCHRGCNGGGHVLERLCGRAYNLAQGAFSLAMVGLYDEALNLIRGIGEIGNVVSLSVADKEAMREWVQADKPTRLKKFSPAKIRDRIAVVEPGMLVATASWYGDLSDKFCHPTPGMRCGLHGGIDVVGGFYQAEGFARIVNELSTTSCILAMITCRYFQFDDLFAEISRHIASLGRVNDLSKAAGEQGYPEVPPER